MLKYAKVENEETGIVSVGLGTNSEFYESIGMTVMDVEEGYDGAWYLKEKLPVQPIEEIKQIKLKELDDISATFERSLNKNMYFTSSLGFKCNGDRRTKDNIQDLITFFDLQAQNNAVQYRDYDNQERSLTKEQLQILLIEHVANGQNLYKQKWNYETVINNSNDRDELNNIKIEFKMTDFSA